MRVLRILAILTATVLILLSIFGAPVAGTFRIDASDHQEGTNRQRRTLQVSVVQKAGYNDGLRRQSAAMAVDHGFDHVADQGFDDEEKGPPPALAKGG